MKLQEPLKKHERASPLKERIAELGTDWDVSFCTTAKVSPEMGRTLLEISIIVQNKRLCLIVDAIFYFHSMRNLKGSRLAETSIEAYSREGFQLSRVLNK